MGVVGLVELAEGVALLGIDDVSGRDLGGELVELFRLRAMLDAEVSRRVRAFDARGDAVNGGHKSTAAWLMDHCRCRPPDAYPAKSAWRGRRAIWMGCVRRGRRVGPRASMCGSWNRPAMPPRTTVRSPSSNPRSWSCVSRERSMTPRACWRGGVTRSTPTVKATTRWRRRRSSVATCRCRWRGSRAIRCHDGQGRLRHRERSDRHRARTRACRGRRADRRPAAPRRVRGDLQADARSSGPGRE